MRACFGGLMVILVLIASGETSTSGQDAEAVPTISALQTRVAELEAQLAEDGTPTPTSAPETSDEAFSDAVSGPALSLIPEGDPGEISVVAVGPTEQVESAWGVPIVIRNNTEEYLTSVGVNGVLRDGDGEIIGVGTEETIAPRVVAPGGLTLVTVGFRNVVAPEGAELEFTVDATPLRDMFMNPFLDLDVLETSYLDNRIVGTFTNSYDEPIGGPFAISAICFDESGAIHSPAYGTTGVDSAQPGEDIPFQVSLTSDQSGSACTSYLVAGFGYPEP